jgi:hypothetical protein
MSWLIVGIFDAAIRWHKTKLGTEHSNGEAPERQAGKGCRLSASGLRT